MSQDKMLTFDPQNMPPKDVYKLLIGAVVPRPIAFVSTLDLNNVRNLAPFSFFYRGQFQPAGGGLLHFSPQRRARHERHIEKCLGYSRIRAEYRFRGLRRQNE